MEKSIILRQFHQKKCRKAMLKLLSGMEEKSNSCLLPTILLAKRLQKVTTNNLTIFLYKLAAKKYVHQILLK